MNNHLIYDVRQNISATKCNKLIIVGYGISVGQNLAWGYYSFDAAIQAWFDEVVDFRYGQGSINGKAVGHYTQVSKV